ncbi:MAG TPA: HD domain-containing protein [Candidatus Latescibacteria bacterium]|nr:HD domain-containing protein [Candidatus Latescibacterota bacterium]
MVRARDLVRSSREKQKIEEEEKKKEEVEQQPVSPLQPAKARSAAPPLAKPAGDEKKDRVADLLDMEGILAEARNRVKEILQAAADEQPFDLTALAPQAKRLTAASREGNSLLRRMIRGKAEGDSGTSYIESLAAHMADLTVLPIRIGMELNYDDEELISLGQASLLHDIGWIRMPPELIGKEKLSDQEIEAVRKHPILGYEVLSEWEEKFPWMTKSVLQEHEREDGSGYPNGLKGQEIDEFAKIIGISDAYEDLIHGKGLPPYRALQQIMSMRNKQFSPRLVKALIQVLSVFPLESLVRLNTGEIGRVVEVSKLHPTRPTIKVLVDAQGKRVSEKRLINLEEEPMLYIADPALDEKDVL